jgi:hypothetical protein
MATVTATAIAIGFVVAVIPIAPPPKNAKRVIYEFVDREKVLYFLW